MKKFLNIFFGKGFVYFISIAIQLFWVIELILRLRNYYVWINMISGVIAVIVALHVIDTRINPAYKLVWTFVILTVPIFGALLYLFIGQSATLRMQNEKIKSINAKFDKYKAEDSSIIEEVRALNKDVANQLTYISRYSGFGAYKNTDVEYHKETDIAMRSLKSALEQAKDFIFMEYFAFEDSKAFCEFEEILIRKVKEGVDVRIIYDDFGSIAYVNKRFFKRLKSEGIKIRAFNPLVPLFYLFMNNRDHRKYTIIDGKVSFTGGYNMCDEYFNYVSPYGYWKDCGIKITGPAVRNHTIMFLEMWNMIKATDSDYSRYINVDYDKTIVNDSIVVPFSDSPLDHESVGENVYLNIIRNAKDYVYIYTPYLILDNEMIEQLCLSSKSGVDVRIVTPGIPDKRIVYKLTQSYYPQLIESGVKIYHYTPGFIHAKCYVCDDEIATVGSINMDYRSLYLHFECGTYMYKADAIKDIKTDFFETFKKSTEVHIKNKRFRKNHFGSFFQHILRLFAPLM